MCARGHNEQRSLSGKEEEFERVHGEFQGAVAPGELVMYKHVQIGLRGSKKAMALPCLCEGRPLNAFWKNWQPQAPR